MFGGLAVFGLIAGFMGVIMLVVAAHLPLSKNQRDSHRVQVAPGEPLARAALIPRGRAWGILAALLSATCSQWG